MRDYISKPAEIENNKFKENLCGGFKGGMHACREKKPLILLTFREG